MQRVLREENLRRLFLAPWASSQVSLVTMAGQETVTPSYCHSPQYRVLRRIFQTVCRCQPRRDERLVGTPSVLRWRAISMILSPST